MARGKLEPGMKPWPKGFCPNPGGRPKGPQLTTILAKFLAMKNLPSMSDPKLTEAERVVLAWVFKLKQGEDKARQQALDRFEGPVANVNFNANTNDLSGQGYEALCDAFFKAEQRAKCQPPLKDE